MCRVCVTVGLVAAQEARLGQLLLGVVEGGEEDLEGLLVCVERGGNKSLLRRAGGRGRGVGSDVQAACEVAKPHL